MTLSRPAAFVLAGLLVACGQRPQATAPRPVPRPAVAVAVAVDPLPSFASLSAPPDMKEHARGDMPPDGRLRLTIASDTCLRASIAGIDLVRAGFEDEVGPRGAPVTDAGLVPRKGPVCVRAGEAITLVVEARAARAIVWRSP